MKQKVVIRVQMEDAKKRAKALKVVVGVPGVLSAAIEGADKNQIVVIGEGVDSITLTTLLRKHMGFAELVTVAAVQEKKEEKKEEKAAPGKTAQPVVVWPSHEGGYYTTSQLYPGYGVQSHYQDQSCCIM